MLLLVSLAILEDKIYKTKGQDCEHSIGVLKFLDGKYRTIATFSLTGNTTEPLKHSRQAETSISSLHKYTGWVMFEIISFLSYLNLYFALIADGGN